MEPGDQLGCYEIVSALGKGGMGEVWKARDKRLCREVAIKILPDDLCDVSARRRFQREAQMASSLNHPHILTVYSVDEFEGRQYLVTEFIDGGTLSDWAKAEKRTWQQTVELLTNVADGLAAAHAAGIMHRDIKPANILVTKSGYAKLADFGSAKLAERLVSAPGDDSPTATETTRPGIGGGRGAADCGRFRMAAMAQHLKTPSRSELSRSPRSPECRVTRRGLPTAIMWRSPGPGKNMTTPTSMSSRSVRQARLCG